MSDDDERLLENEYEEEERGPHQLTEMSSGEHRDYECSLDYYRYFFSNKRRLIALGLIVLGLLSITLLLVIGLLPRSDPDLVGEDDDLDIDPEVQSMWGLRLSSEGLEELAESVKSAMSRSETADPCQDFYEYACGGWLEDHPESTIPADKSSWSRSFSTMAKRNNDMIIDILSGNWPLIHPFFKSCLDQTRRDELGFSPLQPLLQMIDEIVLHQDVINALAVLHRSQVTSMFSFWVDADEKDTSNNILYLDQGGLLLGDRDYYESSAAFLVVLRDQYTNHTFRTFLLANYSTSDALQMTAWSFQFESQLAHFSEMPDERQDMNGLYHKGSFGSFMARPDTAPDFDLTEIWSSYLRVLRGSTTASLTIDTPVIAINKDFLSNMTQLIFSTPIPQLQAYLRWMVLAEFSSELSQSFVQEDFFWLQAQYGLQSPPTLLNKCTSITNSILGELIGRYYVAEVFPERSKTIALNLVNRVVSVFNQTISDATWITSDETKDHAHDKMNKLTKLIGYPDKWWDYSGLNIVPGKFMDSIMNARQLGLDDMLLSLGQPVDKTQWMMTPQTVNAYYAPEYNEIVFPAAILQEPFFNASWPASMNFGAIGMVIGHEIGHSTDDEGSQFDSNGDLDDWWDAASWDRFVEKTHCVRDLYSSFQVPGISPPLFLDGELTMGENIADIGGLRFAYQAYQNVRAHSDQKNTQIQDIFGLTNSQLFFVSYAQSWCTTYRPEYLRWLVLNNPHSPAMFRVNGAVSQNEFFSKAFNCPATSPMGNLTCSVW